MKSIVFGITGASGSVYAEKILDKLSKLDTKVYLIASKNGEEIFKEETGKDLKDYIKKFSNIRLEKENNFYSPIASGGNNFDVLVCPTSMGFLGRVSCGISSNLLERAVDVAFKERRKVVLAVRESPFNLIHLENMLNLAKAGAIIMPLSPFFYLKPKSIDELIESFVDRVLKVFIDGYELEKKWG
jgi:4-hydroxy-3-polyprenylbenzoate decarboxylase